MKCFMFITMPVVLLMSCAHICMASEDTTLIKEIVTRFLHAADSGQTETIFALYDNGFTSTRVVDQGPVIKMDRQQMIYFWKMQTSPKPAGNSGTASSGQLIIKTLQTTIHSVEVIENLAIVLMTRIKDLGNGPEPIFYNLVWKKQADHWLLLREIVHQRTLPKMVHQ